MISFVLPVHNERENLAPLFAEIATAAAGEAYEIVAVDDGSTDGSLAELECLAATAPVHVVPFSTNAGQSAALAAGWRAAGGDIVVMLDADGQNDPADAPRLVAVLREEEGVAAAVGVRMGRRDGRWKLLQSRVANTVRNWVTGDRVRDTGCGLKAVRRETLLRLPQFDGMHRFLPTLIRMQGGRVRELPVSHRPRRHGRSKYGMWDRALRGLRDALGVRWLIRRQLRYPVAGVQRNGDEE